MGLLLISGNVCLSAQYAMPAPRRPATATATAARRRMLYGSLPGGLRTAPAASPFVSSLTCARYRARLAFVEDKSSPQSPNANIDAIESTIKLTPIDLSRLSGDITFSHYSL